MLTSKNSTIYLLILFISLCLIIISGRESIAQDKIRIGVFDSRAVAVAFYNSKFSNVQQIFGEIGKRMKAAQDSNNTEEITNIQEEAKMRQAFIHEQGFGKGSVSAIMEMMKDKIIELSNKENLNVLISRWELVFTSTNAEVIDVTDKITDLFEPDERIKTILQEMKKQEPIPDAYLIKD
jgi:hypothetical protein